MKLPKPSKSQQQALNLYAELMDEAKNRLSWIEHAVNGHTGFPAVLVREFCYLQLRMLCELIALGCLVAHGDIEQSTKLQKEWAANKILAQLAALHPSFYPQAAFLTLSITFTSGQ